MNEPAPAASKGKLPLAALMAAIGLFYILVGLRLLPVSNAAANENDPHWLVLCAGLAFLLAGVAVAIQTFGHANAAGELPAAAPRWMRAGQHLSAFTITACLGAIGSWVAFGPGEREISGGLPFLSPAVNSMIGRSAFGVGAVLIWLCLAAIAVSGLRKYFASGNPDPD
jgi:hypothetical protein